MNAIHIRQAGPQDATAITALTHAAYAKWVPVIGRKPLPMTVDYTEALRHHRIDLLHENHTLAALIEMVPKDGFTLIENLAVSPGFQKHGHGRRLLAHAEALTAAQGHSVLRLYTNQKFEENISFYLALGYKIFLEEPITGDVLVHMEKMLEIQGRNR